MSETLAWWVMLQVVGLAALPLCLSLFQRLPDKGYALSKAFGLLLVGYIFWILVHIGLPNTTRGIWFVLLLVAAASAILLWRRRDVVVSFVREHWWLIIATEAILLLTFITAAYLRSYVPDFGGTEKPMDLMFLNALTRAESFPPADPWLAGESVSYYYFGYLLVSVMTRLSDTIASVPIGIGYNLGLAMIVALAVTGAFGLIYNLTAPSEASASDEGDSTAEGGPDATAVGFSSKPLWKPMIFGLAGALLLATMGNLEGLLELLAAHNYGSAGFWSWINVPQLSAYNSTSWFPDQFWFWWRATRILDAGAGIHEIPFFSFLLGDLHPHVMSIPFVLLTGSIALALLRSDEPLDLVVWLERPLWLIGFGLIVGGLAFLNTWDMPTMAFLIALIVVLRNRLNVDRWSWGLALDSVGFLIPLFLVAFLAYLPFFFGGFDSQAAGFTAHAGAGSSLFHTFLLWGPFALLVLPYAIWRLSQHKQDLTWVSVLWALAPVFIILLVWLAWDLLAAVFGVLPKTLSINEAGFPGESVGLVERFTERGWNWLTVILMAGSVGLLGLALVREVEHAKDAMNERAGHIFALAIAATAALLILGSEFIYIQDGFSSRLNTIFKLYYQAWLLLSIAGGFVLYELFRNLRVPAFSLNLERWSVTDYVIGSSTLVGAGIGFFLMPDMLTRIFGALIGGAIFFSVSGTIALLWLPPEPGSSGIIRWRGIWGVAVAAMLLSAFVYPVMATFNRTEDFGLPRTLNGLERIEPAELEAINWLNDRDGQPVIAEALGSDYSEGGRISAATGLPTLLQWPGHELQWRGDSAPQTGRTEDLEALYTSSDVNTVRSIIEKYDIRYVVVGRREHSAYEGVILHEMTELFELAFPGEVAIYRVRSASASEVSR